MTLVRYQDRSGAGFEQVPGSFEGRICDVEQVPGSFHGKICDIEQVPGSVRDRICDVELVPWAVAGARGVAVAGPGARDGRCRRHGRGRQGHCEATKVSRCEVAAAWPRARNIIIDIYILEIEARQRRAKQLLYTCVAAV